MEKEGTRGGRIGEWEGGLKKGREDWRKGQSIEQRIGRKEALQKGRRIGEKIREREGGLEKGRDDMRKGGMIEEGRKH